MQANLFQSLRIGVSGSRLDVYRDAGSSDFDVVCKYLWNIDLCSALYQPLQNLEIVLRNSFHAAARRRYGADSWFDTTATFTSGLRCPLRIEELERVAEAKHELTQRGKAITPCGVVAGLSFGFWTTLLTVRYDQVFWPWMLMPVFPNMVRKERTPAFINGRMHSIRKLRNRVFHHERVSHYVNLVERYEEVVEAIGWMSRDWAALTRATDRFLQIHADGLTQIRARMRTLERYSDQGVACQPLLKH